MSTVYVPQPTSTTFVKDAEPWMDEGECLYVPMEVFFPERGEGYADARKVCNVCTVSEECLLFAMMSEGRAQKRYGMFGGMEPEERYKLYKKLKGIR